MDHWTLLKAVPFVLGTVAGVTLARRSHGRGSSWRVSSCGGVFLAGAMGLVFLMAVHTVCIPIFRYLEPLRVPPSAGRSFMLAGIRYDYRLYSLVLMGAVMLRYAWTCLRAARGVANGESIARRRAWRATAMLALLTVPLIPLSFEAWLYASVLGLNALALLVSRGAGRAVVSSPVLPAPLPVSGSMVRAS